MDKVIIFDTTLRDGEQTPGATLNVQEKLEIAWQLDRLGVDVIEAGTPVNSAIEMEAVSLIAREVRRPIICGLARALPQDVEAAAKAVEMATHPRIHTFLSSSDIHLMHQLKKDREQVLMMAVEAVKRAKTYVDDVEFSPMDASRSEPAYVYQLIKACIEAGATTVNIPDTVGYSTPEEFGELIRGVFQNVPNIDKAVVSVHCHDDLGLAVANSLAAIRAGARQVECTINGLGERAGNASLEEIVMALRTRQDFFNFITNIDTTQIYQISRLVSELTGIAVQLNKAIVGGNAFRHESGIHQDGIIKERATYEIMNPRDIGVPGTILSLGKLSGRHAFREHLLEMGYTLSDEALSRSFTAFQELATKKKAVDDRDIEALVAEEMRHVSDLYKLDHVQVSSGDPGVPTASVRLTGPQGEPLADAALGNGPVDAVYNAINRAIGQVVDVSNKLVEFSVKSITETTEALGEVTIRIESEGSIYTGRGAHTDIIVASARAYVNALNRLLTAQRSRKDQKEEK
ncbi:MAG: 2-isopropylmalate synthase [Chloroflexi bacterium]|nr:2-isopropylmalate synthase [Chloroflexota bacterium]